MSRLRSQVLEWFEAGRVVRGCEHEALRAARTLPAPAQWRTFLDRLTLWLATVALAASVIFFFAANWDALGRFARFGLVEAAIVAGLVACWRSDLDRPAGKAILTLLALLVGALLALTGQTYQTGADSYELFGWWAALILPWVLVGRFSPLWLLWLALLNAAVWLYFARGSEGEDMLWALFALNAAALAAWEAAHRAGISWLADSWPPRLVAIAAGTAATALAVWVIVDADGIAGVAAWLVWMGAVYGWYRHARPDLFMLAGGVLSLIVVVIAFLLRHGGEDGGTLLLIGLAVIALSGGGAMWLRHLARELEA